MTELNITQLEYNPQVCYDAPILSLTKTIETIDSETFDNGQEAKQVIKCLLIVLNLFVVVLVSVQG